MDRKVIGILFIVIGVFLALGTTGMIAVAWGTLWPLFILVPAIGFHVGFFSHPKPGRAGLLVPGGVLLTVGLLFLYCGLFGWWQMSYLWPFFILAPAVGLFEMFLFGSRNPYLLIPVLVLTTVAMIFLGVNLLNSSFGGVAGGVLILIGLLVIFGKRKSADDKSWF